MDFQEKRESFRKVTDDFSVTLRPLDPQVWFKFWNGLEYTARDISLVGVGLYSREMLPAGTPLSVDIRLGKDEETIRIFGKIIWVHGDTEKGYRSGVSFSWWKDESDKKSVTNFVNNTISTN